MLEGDAAVMLGKDCSFGAVAALQGYKENCTVYSIVLQDEGTIIGRVGTQGPWFYRDAADSSPVVFTWKRGARTHDGKGENERVSFLSTFPSPPTLAPSLVHNQ